MDTEWVNPISVRVPTPRFGYRVGKSHLSASSDAALWSGFRHCAMDTEWEKFHLGAGSDVAL